MEHADYLLNEAYKKIAALEEKIISLEGRVPKTYPDVNFLNYLKRKRILVSWRRCGCPSFVNINRYFRLQVGLDLWGPTWSIGS